MDKETFEAELKREGYEVLTNTTPGPKANPEHTHPFDVKAMVLEGAITLGSNNTSRTFTAGDIFTMARGCPHTESYGPEGAVILSGRRR